MAYKRIGAGKHLFYQLQLDKFFEELRRNGYRVGVDTHLRVQQLLLSLASNNEMPDNPMLLQPMLAALVCGSETEQQQFPNQFQSWLVQQNLAGKGQPAADVPVAEENERFQELIELAQTEEKGLFFAIVLAAFFVLLALLRFNHSSQPHEFELSGLLQTEDGAPFAHSPISFAGQKDSTDSSGKFRFTFIEAASSGYLTVDSTGYSNTSFAIPRSKSIEDTSLVARQDIPIVQVDSTAIVLSDTVPDSLQPTYTTYKMPIGWEWYWPMLLLYLLPATLALLYAGYYYWRRRFVLQRRPPRGEPTFEEWLLELSDANPLFMSSGMRRSSQELRRHLLRDSGRVDVESTITATLEAGGVLTPVSGREKVTPEYLLLRQRHGRNDQSDEWIKALIFRLKEQGILLNNYEFSGSAGLCRDVDDPRSSRSIEALYSRFAHCRLLIFADADSMFNPLSGVALPWLKQLDDWQHKAIFVPPEQLKLNRWLPEALEEQDCLLFEANADGLEALVERLIKNDMNENGAQILPHSEWEEWIDPPGWLTGRTPPNQKQISHLLGKLKRWFNNDEAGYHWLAACAVFPLLRWELTLFLGEQLRGSKEMPLLNEERLEKLVQLPWFRRGFLPDWLREALLISLSKDQDAYIRNILSDVMRQRDTGLSSGFPLNVADDRSRNLREVAARQWRRLIDTALPGLPDDAIFKDFIQAPPSRSLLFFLPEEWQRRLAPLLRNYLAGMALTLFVLLATSAFFLAPPVQDKIINSPVEMLLVPGGEFDMGSNDEDADTDEQPVHRVQVGDFYMGRYEVTIGQFLRFIDEQDTTKRSERVSWRPPDYSVSVHHPVVNVSWEDAVRFCNWMSDKTGRTRVYSETDSGWTSNVNADGFRLPTEAEWEYAARGGKQYKYPWGEEGILSNIADSMALQTIYEGLITIESNYGDNFAYASPVGSFRPNPFGLEDLGGNVWEWCSDWYDAEYYQQYSDSAVARNPIGPQTGSGRVLRGGSWFNPAQNCRSACRHWYDPDDRNSDVGFRLVLPSFSLQKLAPNASEIFFGANPISDSILIVNEAPISVVLNVSTDRKDWSTHVLNVNTSMALKVDGQSDIYFRMYTAPDLSRSKILVEATLEKNEQYRIFYNQLRNQYDVSLID